MARAKDAVSAGDLLTFLEWSAPEPSAAPEDLPLTVVYEDDRPVWMDTIVVSTQHSPDVSHREIRDGVIEEVVQKVIPAKMIRPATRFMITPTGRFVVITIEVFR